MSLINLTASENFVNDAATGAASYPKNGDAPTLSAAPSTMTVGFDVTTRGYTLTVGGRTITFLPSDIDAANSNAGVTAYVKTNGTTSDTLTLTKPGTSGRFNYQYVGGGYWQRTIDGATTVSGTLDAFSYGLASPVSAVPRTGRAQYTVDILGAVTQSSSVAGIVGEGTAQLNLDDGILRIEGVAGLANTQGTQFTSQSTIASAANNFNGSFAWVTPQGTAVGPLSGRFYGPEAQELGAAFSGQSTTPSNFVVVGTVLGRGGRLSNLPFDAAQVNSLTAGQSVTYDTGTKAFAGGQSRNQPLIVNFDAATGKYTLISSTLSEVLTPFTTTTFANIETRLTSFQNNDQYAFLDAFEHEEKRSQTANSARYAIQHILTGTRTPTTAMPLTGKAGYNSTLWGRISDTRFGNFASIQGFAAVTVDFASATVAVDGTYSPSLPVTTSSAPITGTVKGSATIGSGTNGYTGTLTLNAPVTYTGSWKGGFYGPNAEESGSVFELSDGAGATVSGTLLGKKDADLVFTDPALKDMTAQKTFSILHVAGTGSGGTGRRMVNRGDLTVTYDPATSSYAFNTNAYTDYNIPAVTMGAAQRTAASNTTRAVYQSSTTDFDITAEVFNAQAGNPVLELSYTSYVDLLFKSKDGLRPDTRITYVFGQNTPRTQLPRSGTARYDGIVVGNGSVGSTTSCCFYALTGTSRFDANFSTGALTAALTAQGRDLAGGANYDFGTLNFDATIGNDAAQKATFSGFASNASGAINGSFFGPGGSEIGAVFEVEKRSATNEIIFMSGAALAKKAP